MRSVLASIWAIIAVGLTALLPTGASAAGTLTLDGTSSGLALGGNKLLLADNIGTLQFRIALDPKSAKGPILSMLGGSTGFQMGFTDDGTGLLFMSVAGEYTISPPGFSDAARHLIAMQLSHGKTSGAQDDAWVLSVDGKSVGVVPGVITNDSGTEVASQYAPAAGDRIQIKLGGPDVIATIDQFEVRTPDNLLYADQTSTGALIGRTLPIFGTYLQTDTGVGVQQVNLLPQIRDIHHGIFKKTTYYALSRLSSQFNRNSSAPDGIMLTADWGGVVTMVPDPDNPNRYKPDSSGDRWVGTLEFDSDARVPGRKIHFKSVGSQALSTRPFLQDGKFYELAPARPDGIDKSDAVKIATSAPRQTSGFVFNVGGTPPNFNFNLNACYNVIEMNLENFQETGCSNRPIFSAPDREDAYKAIPPHILPLGWNWLVDSASEEGAESHLAASAQEMNSSLVGGSSSDFTALGYSQQHNKQTDHEQSDLTSKEEMETIQQYFRRSQSVVLAPTEVELDSCFIHYVLRAAATAYATGMHVTVDQIPESMMPHGPSYYDPAEAEERCEGSVRDPLTPDDLLAKYGTHYAAAITYGSRTISKSQYAMSTIKSLVSNNTDLSDAEGYQFEATVSAGNGKNSVSFPVKVGKSSSKTSTTGSSSSNETTVKREHTSIICYGSPCAAGLPQDGNTPIPMYLDLVRFDYLLAPPFFTDPLVLAVLRPAVARELDRMLMEESRPNLLTAYRVIDVDLKSADCWEDPAAPKAKTILSETGGCPTLDIVGGLYAFTTKPGGGQQHVDLKPIDVDSDAGGPSISDMKACLDGSGSPACAHKKFRMTIDPYVQKPGAVLADDSIIGFMLNFRGNKDNQSMLNQLYIYDETSSCGKACAGVQIAYDWKFDSNNRGRPAYSKALYFFRASPTPASLKGDLYIEADPTTKNKVLAYTATLDLKDNLEGALGYPEMVEEPARTEIISLDSIKPNQAAKEFPWQLSDGELNGIKDFDATRRRCEAVFGYGNCEMKGDSYWSKPAEQRTFPKPYDRS
jgi:hypothetical protein